MPAVWMCSVALVDKDPAMDTMAAPSWHSSRELMQQVGTVQQLASTGLAAAWSEADSGP